MPYANRGHIEIDSRTRKKLEGAIEFLKQYDPPYKYINSWNDFFKVFIRQVEQFERDIIEEGKI